MKVVPKVKHVDYSVSVLAVDNICSTVLSFGSNVLVFALHLDYWNVCSTYSRVSSIS